MVIDVDRQGREVGRSKNRETGGRGRDVLAAAACAVRVRTGLLTGAMARMRGCRPFLLRHNHGRARLRYGRALAKEKHDAGKNCHRACS